MLKYVIEKITSVLVKNMPKRYTIQQKIPFLDN